MTTEILLSSGHIALVDDVDVTLVLGTNWHLKVRGGGIGQYARSNRPGGGSTYMHRLILGVSDPRVLVDHVDGNGLNNTRTNLRLCSNKENSRNRACKTKAVSGFLGVGYLPYSISAGRRIPRQKPWFAHVTVDGKSIFGGYFLTPEEAAIKRDAMAIEHHGNFAALNFKNERGLG